MKLNSVNVIILMATPPLRMLYIVYTHIYHSFTFLNKNVPLNLLNSISLEIVRHRLLRGDLRLRRAGQDCLLSGLKTHSGIGLNLWGNVTFRCYSMVRETEYLTV